MRAAQFFAINRQIAILSREEEARALLVTHHSKPGDRVRELIHEMNAERKVKIVTESSLTLIGQGQAKPIATSDVVAIRERQKAAADEIKKDRAAWMERVRQQIAEQRSTESKPES